MPKYNLLDHGKAAEFLWLSFEVQTKKLYNSGSFSFKLFCLLLLIILKWFMKNFFWLHLTSKSILIHINYTYVYVYLYMFVCVRARVCVYIYIYIYIYLHFSHPQL